MPDHPVKLSQELLRKVRNSGTAPELLEQLAGLNPSDLPRHLPDDASKMAFWINVYNALVLYSLHSDASQYQNRHRFFSEKRYQVAAQSLSLDDIEHGILRRSKSKWSLGYWNKCIVSDFEKTHRVHKPDYRIHFGLNCGAASCPPIAFYDPSQLASQLTLATENYLRQQVSISKGAVYLPRLMLWFHGDFGGRAGIQSLLQEYGLLSSGQRLPFRYKAYNWTLQLDK